jgi:hypothetical protein
MNFTDTYNTGLSYNQGYDITEVEPSGGITEPVDLTEAKNFCKIDVDDDDALIESLITTGRIMCEDYTNIGFVKRTVIVELNNGNGNCYLPLGPVGEIESLKDMDGNEITDPEYGGSTWKQIISPRYNRMVITYEAGYETLPENLRTALLNTIYYLYDNRAVGVDNIGPIAQMILNPLRRVW